MLSAHGPAAIRLSLVVFNRSALMTLWPTVRLCVSELEWQCLALASRTVEDAGRTAGVHLFPVGVTEFIFFK